MIILRNLAFYLVFYLSSLPIFFVAAIGVYVSRPLLRKACEGWSAWHRWCCRWLLGIKVVETGTRPEGPAFYAIKHESFFEAIDVPHLFDHPAGFAKQELFEIPAWGKAARAYGAVPVARDEGAKTLRFMVREITPMAAAGRPVVIFPEGTRLPHGERAPLQSGFALLYKLLKLPVVPVAVNSGPLYHRRWKRSGTLTIHFGEAISPGLSREEIESRVHDGINALNSKT